MAMSKDYREFDTGAYRNLDEEKLDFEGFFSPRVLERYARYMHQHRRRFDGTMRASDNWQLGIPLVAYMKSGWRHFFDWWKGHRGEPAIDLEDSLCALIFNASGYLHELLKERQVELDNRVGNDGTASYPATNGTLRAAGS